MDAGGCEFRFREDLYSQESTFPLVFTVSLAEHTLSGPKSRMVLFSDRQCSLIIFVSGLVFFCWCCKLHLCCMLIYVDWCYRSTVHKSTEGIHLVCWCDKGFYYFLKLLFTYEKWEMRNKKLIKYLKNFMSFCVLHGIPKFVNSFCWIFLAFYLDLVGRFAAHGPAKMGYCFYTNLFQLPNLPSWIEIAKQPKVSR